ncbi:MAG: penicillin-binding protein activator LpoB [Leptospiraceae bacterium]|nr:penicillin-binding protein activator LpoB [Leptospiraceae bacterium]
MKFFLILIISFYMGCASLAEKAADSGGLTRIEMEQAAFKIAGKIAEHFKANPNKNGIFVALLATKNETSEQFPVELFDDALVRQLILNKIYTLRTDKRQDQLKEIAFDQKMGISGLDLGKLKSPNYFLKARIDENAFRSDGDKIVEQILTVEFIEVESLAVKVSEKEVFTKKAKTPGVGW